MADLLGIVAESHPVCSFNWQDYFAGRFKKNGGLHPGSKYTHYNGGIGFFKFS
jgi:hypothetical protein